MKTVAFSEGRLVLIGPAGLKRAAGPSAPAILGAGKSSVYRVSLAGRVSLLLALLSSLSKRFNIYSQAEFFSEKWNSFIFYHDIGSQTGKQGIINRTQNRFAPHCDILPFRLIFVCSLSRAHHLI